MLTILLLAGLAQAAPSLDEKFLAQCRGYQTARQVLRDEVGCKGKPKTRAEWDAILAVKSDLALTAEDRAALVERQEKAISAAREASRKVSAFNLDEIRKNPAARKTFCAGLPKGGMLHVHPGGTVDAETSLAILREANPKLDKEFQKCLRSADPEVNSAAAVDPCETELIRLLGASDTVRFTNLFEDLQHAIANFAVMPEGAKGFVRFQASFSLQCLYKLVDKFDANPTIYHTFLQRLHDQHVSYVEFTKSCPKLMSVRPGVVLNKGLLDSHDVYMDKYAQAHQVDVRSSCAFKRTDNPAQNARNAELLFEQMVKRQRAGKPYATLKGIDLIGDEDPEDQDPRKPPIDVSALGAGQRIYACRLEKIAKEGLLLHATQHAGELGHPENPRDAMIMGADRIGHGLKLADDPVALEYARRRRENGGCETGAPAPLAIETNLVSNKKLTPYEVGSNPFLKYLRLGLPVSLSTDDEGILHTDINHECEEAIAHTDVTYDEMKRMSYNSIRQSFADEALKQKLLAQLDQEFAGFEQAMKAQLFK